MDRHNQVTVVLSLFTLFLAVRIQAADVCADLASNCRSYGQSVCVDYQGWAKINCNYTCKFCQGQPPQKPCVDVKSDCSKYVSDICTSSSFKVWAQDNCAKFCGFCSTATTSGVTTTVTTPAAVKTTNPPTQTTPQAATTPCLDGLGFCLVYSKTACNDVAWADKYCKKYCARC